MANAGNVTKSKKLKFAYRADRKHWVGNGFHVHGMLHPGAEIYPFISPFILLDYASPRQFEKALTPRGVGEHPHRGFETVTLAYQGEVAHRDSSGGGGIIKPGDVQWMTAGSGVVHDEFHSDDFTQKGGIFEMIQLWVNLPAEFKMTPPKYQSIKSTKIPDLKIGNSGKLRVIAGSYKDQKGPSSTFTPINLYDIETVDEENLSLEFSAGTNTIILIMNGQLTLEKQLYQDKSILIFEPTGEIIDLKTSKDFKGLILNGQPINEPIAAHGPFVMNTREEIIQAMHDYQNGKMGHLKK